MIELSTIDTKELLQYVPKALHKKPYVKYALDVLTNKIIAGRWVKLACLRFFNDFKNPNYTFNAKKVQHVHDFINLFTHFKGSTSGRKFELLPWQSFFVSNIFGWYEKDDNGEPVRRFTEAVLQISRKNGKTALSAVLCLYCLIADGEPSAEVVLSANSKDQASTAYEYASTFLAQLDPKKQKTEIYRDRIKFDGNVLKTLANDTSKLDGMNVSCALLDEAGGAPDQKMRAVIKSSQTMRQNPLMIYISTAYYDLTNYFYNMRCTGIDILEGTKTNENQFILIYEMDIDDIENSRYLTDESIYTKFCPSVGNIVRTKAIRKEITDLKNDFSQEIDIKTKTLNIWCTSNIQNYIPLQYVYEVYTDKVDLEKYRGLIAVLGLDLASTSDFCALSCLVLPQDGRKPLFINRTYICETGLRESPNRDLYQMWARQGLLTVTDGNATDYNAILNDIKWFADIFDINMLGYDRYNAQDLCIRIEDECNITTFPVSQTIAGMNGACKLLARWIRLRMCEIEKSDLMTFQFQCATTKNDWMGNQRTVKMNWKESSGSEKFKIDNIIACQMCQQVLLDSDYGRQIIYDIENANNQQTETEEDT